MRAVAVGAFETMSSPRGAEGAVLGEVAPPNGRRRRGLCRSFGPGARVGTPLDRTFGPPTPPNTRSARGGRHRSSPFASLLLCFGLVDLEAEGAVGEDGGRAVFVGVDPNAVEPEGADPIDTASDQT